MVVMVQGGMAAVLQTMLVSGSAFVASNLDDIVLLLLFFANAQTNRDRWQIVIGQYLGFTVLILASLGGFFGGHLVAPEWIGLLGLLPISLGLSRLSGLVEQSSQIESDTPWQQDLKPFPPSLDALAIASVTIANGGDNIGIYLPLVCRATPMELLISFGVFIVMVSGWCLAALGLVRAPAVATFLEDYGQPLLPYVYIILGFFVLIDSHAFQQRLLSTIVLVLLLLMLIPLLRHLHGLQSSSLTPAQPVKPWS